MTFTLDLDEPIDCRPRPPFDIDPRPISPEEARAWRGGLWHPKTQAEMSAVFGSKSLWNVIENKGMKSPSWCALIRAWFVERASIEYSCAPASMVVDLATMVGGWPAFAEAIGTPAQTCRGWVSNYGRAPRKGGCGALIRWLHKELNPEPSDEVPYAPSSRRKLTDDQVREIRRRRRAGESCGSIAEDYPVHPASVHLLTVGRTYTDVG